MDVGQPKDFLSGTCLYLSSLQRKNPKLLASPNEPYVYGGNVMIDESAKIGKNCRIGPNVTIGPNVVIGDGVRLQRCVLLKNSRVKDHAWIKSTIVGWNSSVGKWARLENVTVLGDDVSIGDEVYVNGGSVLPHKSIKQNVDSKLPCRSTAVPLLTRISSFDYHVNLPSHYTNLPSTRCDRRTAFNHLLRSCTFLRYWSFTFCEQLHKRVQVSCLFLSTPGIIHQKRARGWGFMGLGWEVRVYGSCRVQY